MCRRSSELSLLHKRRPRPSRKSLWNMAPALRVAKGAGGMACCVMLRAGICAKGAGGMARCVMLRAGICSVLI